MQSVQKMKGFQQNTSSSCREQKRLTYCYIVLGSTHEYHLNYILRSIVPFFEVVYCKCGEIRQTRMQILPDT